MLIGRILSSCWGTLCHYLALPPRNSAQRLPRKLLRNNERRELNLKLRRLCFRQGEEQARFFAIGKRKPLSGGQAAETLAKVLAYGML